MSIYGAYRVFQFNLEKVVVVTFNQCSGRIRFIWRDPDPHRDGENGSGTDPGSIKGSQNKGDKNVFFFIEFFKEKNVKHSYSRRLDKLATLNIETLRR